MLAKDSFIFSFYTTSPAMAKCGPGATCGPSSDFCGPCPFARPTCVCTALYVNAYVCGILNGVWRRWILCTSSSFPSTPSKSEGHYVGTETKRREKCFTRALGRSRKSGDCKRMWHKEWELEYLEVTTAKMQYSAYRNDCSLDYQFL